jgi:hypothetical protein
MHEDREREGGARRRKKRRKVRRSWMYQLSLGDNTIG